VAHRDDRDAARDRIAALERQLTDAEADRAEVEAELARSETERLALERQLRGEPGTNDEAWTREEFAKRVAKQAPRAPLDLWPERPAPIARSAPPAPHVVATRVGEAGTRWTSRPPATRAQLSAALLASALSVHLPWMLWVGRFRDVMSPAAMDALMAGQLVGGVLQTFLHFLLLSGLRVPRPRLALGASALMSIFSAFLMGVLVGWTAPGGAAGASPGWPSGPRWPGRGRWRPEGECERCAQGLAMRGVACSGSHRARALVIPRQPHGAVRVRDTITGSA